MSDQAYRKVLAGLFDRTVPAGAFVSQKTLIDLLDVPLQPLRDALRVLEAEGIVTIHPRSGIQFLQPDMQFVHNTYQFRSLIERAAARRFAETADDAVIAQLIDAHNDLLSRLGEGNANDPDMLAEVGLLDQDFHAKLNANLNNPLLQTASRRLQNYVRLIQLDRRITRPYAMRTLREHLDILEACAERNADAAEQALVGHFQAALGRMMGGF
ncbi:GntR family transcriptional regulator [Sphingobium algorifonticola]|uniref:GntR family transcriptional regulator n=1 Tax=Sphingobium algorifonticola TaxID=2008318 RepID=UPI0019CF6A4A|nr:GntR family transcriptional regulator [Sphingobium algorifonticola]